MTISGQIEVKNYSDKAILRFLLSIVFFVDIWADFCGKLARFREFLTHIGIFEHFWDIFDPFPIQKAPFFVENMTWTYIGWHQKLFYGWTKPSESRHFSLLFKTNSHFHKSSQKSEFYSNGDPFLNPLRHFNCSIHAFISFRSDQESETLAHIYPNFHRWRHLWLMTSLWTNRIRKRTTSMTDVILVTCNFCWSCNACRIIIINTNVTSELDFGLLLETADFVAW